MFSDHFPIFHTIKTKNKFSRALGAAHGRTDGSKAPGIILFKYV